MKLYDRVQRQVLTVAVRKIGPSYALVDLLSGERLSTFQVARCSIQRATEGERHMLGKAGFRLLPLGPVQNRLPLASRRSGATE